MEAKSYDTANIHVQRLFKDILAGIQRIEETVSERIEPIKKQLDKNSEYEYVIKYGLEGFRNKILNSQKEKQAFNPQTWEAQLVQKEPSLKFPHRKILEYLSRQYDYENNKFKEVNFSSIVRECKVGKNRALQYLRFLERKGMIKQRNDGYRVWYKIKNDC